MGITILKNGYFEDFDFCSVMYFCIVLLPKVEVKVERKERVEVEVEVKVERKESRCELKLIETYIHILYYIKCFSNTSIIF